MLALVAHLIINSAGTAARPVFADDRPGRLSDPQVKTVSMSAPADVKKKHHYGHHHHGSSGGGVGNAAGGQQQNKKPKLEGQSLRDDGRAVLACRVIVKALSVIEACFAFPYHSCSLTLSPSHCSNTSISSIGISRVSNRLDSSSSNRDDNRRTQRYWSRSTLPHSDTVRCRIP